MFTPGLWEARFPTQLGQGEDANMPEKGHTSMAGSHSVEQ